MNFMYVHIVLSMYYSIILYCNLFIQDFARNIRTSRGSYFGLTNDENTIFRLHDIINDALNDTNNKPTIDNNQAMLLVSNYLTRSDVHKKENITPDHVFGKYTIPSDDYSIPAKIYLRTRRYTNISKNKTNDTNTYDETVHNTGKFSKPLLETERFIKGALPIESDEYFIRLYGNILRNFNIPQKYRSKVPHLPPDIPSTIIPIDEKIYDSIQPPISGVIRTLPRKQIKSTLNTKKNLQIYKLYRDTILYNTVDKDKQNVNTNNSRLCNLLEKSSKPSSLSYSYTKNMNDLCITFTNSNPVYSIVNKGG